MATPKSKANVGDDSQCSAVLVKNYAHMALFLLHLPHNLGYLHRTRQVDRFLDQLANRQLIAAVFICLDEIFFIDYTNNIIKIFLIYGHSRIFLAEEFFTNIFRGVGNINRGYPHARRDYLINGDFIEPKRAADEIALLLFKDAFVLDFIDYRNQLLLGDADALLLAA